MEYPFAHKEHKIYANTFLQNVLVEWYYPLPNQEFDDGLLKTFFKDNFNIELLIEEGISFPVMIGSTDHSINLYFGKDAFKLRVGVDAYKGFRSLRFFFNKGLDFLKILQVERMERIRIRKINIWPYENIGGKNTSKEILLQKIFSGNLLKGNIIHSSNDASQVLWDKCFKNEDQSEDICIKYGFSSNYEDYKDLMILDTYIERTMEISNNDIAVNLIQMNQILFDAYHWSVNQKIVEIMDKEIVK